MQTVGVWILWRVRQTMSFRADRNTLFSGRERVTRVPHENLAVRLEAALLGEFARV